MQEYQTRSIGPMVVCDLSKPSTSKGVRVVSHIPSSRANCTISVVEGSGRAATKREGEERGAAVC